MTVKTATLSISVSTNPVAQTIVSGARGFTLRIMCLTPIPPART